MRTCCVIFPSSSSLELFEGKDSLTKRQLAEPCGSSPSSSAAGCTGATFMLPELGHNCTSREMLMKGCLLLCLIVRRHLPKHTGWDNPQKP